MVVTRATRSSSDQGSAHRKQRIENRAGQGRVGGETESGLNGDEGTWYGVKERSREGKQVERRKIERKRERKKEKRTRSRQGNPQMR